MQILVDTRQKKGKHDNINNYFKCKKIEIVSKKLDVGDYMLENGKISIDTKQDIYELAMDFFSKTSKARFQRECKLAKKRGLKFYILIEQDFNKERLLNWKSRKKVDGTLITKATGKQIYNKMRTYSFAFGVYWRFCRKHDTGKKIMELLGVEK